MPVSTIHAARLSLVLVAAAGSLALAGEAQATFPGSNGRIVFETNRDYPGAPGGELYTMTADGGSLQRLTFTAAGVDNGEAAYSPNGRRIVFQSDRGGSGEDLYLIDSDGTHETRLTSMPGDEAVPNFSPDGRHVTFLHGEAGGAPHIWVMGVGGGNPHQITAGEGEIQPNWAPDGKRIAYTSTAGGNLDVWTVVRTARARGA